MKKKLLHTPEGVRDIYNEECEKKQVLQDKLKNAIECYGYHIIQTPTFEFFDIFGKEIGTTSSKNLYKFFDREGNTLVLRPDITPSVARAAAKYFSEEDMPIRLYYMGNTFINNSSYQGRLKENTQLGAELIGDNSVAADAEIISMAVECLLAAGLKEFQLSVGHSDFFMGLIEAAGLDEDTEDELRELIANKNFFGVEEVISNWKMDENLQKLFKMLGRFYFSIEEMAKARTLAASYPKILAAITRLEELHTVLEIYGIDKYVSYELGMVSNYQYYTGIIFAGYTFGSGEPILNGGRYDKLLPHFGKQAASIGFAIVVDQVMAALSRQKITIDVEYKSELIVYTKQNLKKAVEAAMKIRKTGGSVELICMDEQHNKSDYEAYAARNHREKITFMDGE
ncbi:MAG: ATP phosphoribosyltransferase regulatory subunit [Lachnospiraceae bacterium]|nr:ATP phosphoribosyltransferase regulatory subunit [Lachnospiraceae bacterium]